MAGIKLDGAGTQKMKTIEEALGTVQTIHGLVERMAVDVKNNRGVGAIPGQIEAHRHQPAGAAEGAVRPDCRSVSAMINRDGTRRRGAGQGPGAPRGRGATAHRLEINAAKVKEQHAVKIEVAPD